MTNVSSNQEWQSSGTPGQAPPPAPGATSPPVPGAPPAAAGAAPQYAYPPQQPAASPMDALQQFAQPKFIFFGIAFGALMLFICYFIALINTTSADLARFATFCNNFGRIVIFFSAIVGGLLIPNQNNYTRLGYLILAGMVI